VRSIDPTDTPASCREEARLVRAQAEEIRYPEVRARLQEIAESYEYLARYLELLDDAA
jgi:hypothetical protein